MTNDPYRNDPYRNDPYATGSEGGAGSGQQPPTGPSPDQPTNPWSRPSDPEQAWSQPTADPLRAREPPGAPRGSGEVSSTPAPGQPPGWPPAGPSPAGYQAPTYPPPAYQAQPVAERRSTNGLAIAALVCSIAGVITAISAPIGAILGHVSLRQIRQTGEEGAPLAKAAIWVGWIITGLIVLSCCAVFAAIGLAGRSGAEFVPR
jgi:hypothetical protein